MCRAVRWRSLLRAANQVGAVNTQLLSVPWLATRAIDLRSTQPRIEQLDFFALAPAAQFGAVVCAMARRACALALRRARALTRAARCARC